MRTRNHVPKQRAPVMVNSIPYHLGLDLGASSLGWAVLGLEKPGGEPNHILAAGVRIFDAGVEGTKGDIEQGKDASRAVVRRQARQPRRQQWRRQHRKQKLFRLLQKWNLLPPSKGTDSAARKLVLDQLDAELTAKYIPDSDHDARQKLPYILRDKAVHGPVDPFELGRALYHLAQRRGYLSNRKGKQDDDEEGKVASGISGLQVKLNEHGDTLGSYFARRHDPFQERIRRRYTGREMYRDEFQCIVEAQKAAFPRINAADWQSIQQAIFFQRPLKSQKHLIGRCELEMDQRGRGRKRCPLALPIAQEFRILQKLNDLRVTTPTRAGAPLTKEERQKLLAALLETSEMKWSKVRTLLKLPKGAKFSHEEGDDKIIGHRTNAKMLPVFGARWHEFSDQQRDAITLEVLHYRKPEALQRRAMNVWGLAEEAAHQLAYKTHLEDDYASHSRRAMEKLVAGTADHPGLKDGASYSTIRSALYSEKFSAGKPLAFLPPVNTWKDDIRNPAVIRALTELRKVVNTLVKKYGKPARIHIELARDIRNSRKKRKDIWNQNQQNKKRREKAVAAMLAECGIAKPKRRDIDKWLLADECNRECPYCGKAINMRSLMGDDAEFNIEHIYPRRFLDDSYLNKTIACRKCNDLKGDRTPAMAFSPEKLNEILARVERFQGTGRDVKLARFKTATPEEDFTTRQLNDTRYNSRLAADYLGLFFGGRVDSGRRQRIFTPTGQLTGNVRNNWQLNDILSPTDEKTRDDHRHHAIDAMVIALMDQKLIAQLANSAEESERIHDRHFFKILQWPWPSFKNDVAFAVEAINVSHRPTRTIAGPLHAESIYSKNLGTEKKPEYRIRKEIQKLSAKEIEGDQIIELSVRDAVQKKYKELGGGLPSKVFADLANHPALKAKDGRLIPIHKVRIRTDMKPRAIGKAVRERNIASGKNSNYASMIYAVLDKDGNEVRWEHEIITRLEAHERLSANHKKAGEKVLVPTETETRKFKFSLRKNEMLLADGPNGDRVLYRVQSISVGETQLCPNNLSSIQGKARSRWNQIRPCDNLRKYKARKVNVDPLGEITEEDSL